MNSNVTFSTKSLEEYKVREVIGLGLGGQGRPLGGGDIRSETLMTGRSLSCKGPVVELHLGSRC